MYEFLRGPMVWVAFIGFWGGLFFQGTRFYSATRKKERCFHPGEKNKMPPAKSLGSIAKWSIWFDQSIYRRNPVMAAVSTLFHVLLFFTPVLVFAHNYLWDASLGIRLVSLSEALTDFMTFALLCCGFFFLLRRVLVRQVRAITTPSDYLALLVTLAPFLTGFLAYHHWTDYRTVLMVHMATGELLLLSIPFTKLGHMIYIFFYRFFIGSEYSFGPGLRSW